MLRIEPHARPKGGIGHGLQIALSLALAACGAFPKTPDPGACTAKTTEPDRYASIPFSGYDQASLKGDIDAMRATIPRGAASPSAASAAAFDDAKRQSDGQHHLEGARGFRGVAKDDTSDRLTRQLAQYFFAVELASLGLHTEARAVFRDVVAAADHPKHEAAVQWLLKTYCE